MPWDWDNLVWIIFCLLHEVKLSVNHLQYVPSDVFSFIARAFTFWKSNDFMLDRLRQWGGGVCSYFILSHSSWLQQWEKQGSREIGCHLCPLLRTPGVLVCFCQEAQLKHGSLKSPPFSFDLAFCLLATCLNARLARKKGNKQQTGREDGADLGIRHVVCC